MKNVETLRLAAKIMEAHNDVIGYETFKSIAFNKTDENIMFRIRFQFLKSAFEICELLNLNVEHVRQDVYIMM